MRATAFGMTGAALLLMLGGCEGKAPEPAPADPVEQAPEVAPGFALSEARVQLPAVAGRPGVAYFTLSQGSGAPRKLAGVAVAGAGRTEMHQTTDTGGVSRMSPVSEVPIEAGRTLAFAPGGYHAMLFELSDELRSGATTELTVTLDNGDKASAPAKVTDMAGAMEQMR